MDIYSKSGNFTHLKVIYLSNYHILYKGVIQMPDHGLKLFGWNQTENIIRKFNLPLQPIQYIETSSLATFQFSCFGKISDITKYDNEFKSLLGPKTTINAEDGFINIVVPRPTPDKVMLKDVLESKFFNDCPGKLKVALGESAKGGIVIGDLEIWQHLMIAGVTDSGKSMFQHTFIHSIISNNTPEEVKFVLCDFKKAEYVMYEDISYLQLPIIYKTKNAVNALKWLLNEMEDRFEIFKEAKCRNIQAYNSKHDPLHHIIVMIDEFPTLTLKEKEAEDYLIELAQMSRAAGIHLILSIQKPTSDVIKGLIKSNFPNKISFYVPTYRDSMVILDDVGAEKLNMKGDMYLKDKDGMERIQGCYLTDEEIEELGDMYRDNNMFNNLQIEFNEPIVDEDYKYFYRAMKYCIEINKCNQSTIYKYLHKGKETADKVIEKAQNDLIISKEKTGYDYEIFITLEEFINKYEEA